MKRTMFAGIIFVTLSVILFSFMTVLVKELTLSGIPSFQVTFFRFLVGFLSVMTLLFAGKKRIKPKSYPWLLARAFANTVAVLIFFSAIDYCGAAKGTVYNLMYPVFVALFSPLVLKEEMSARKLFLVLLGFLGTFLVSGVSFGGVARADLIGLASGVSAGIAIVSLRRVRMTDESFTILFFLMTIGVVVTGILVIPVFVKPTVRQLALLILMGLFSFGGQYTLTYGFRYVSAVAGAVLSSTRIFVASLFAFLFLNEVMTVVALIGGLLIFLSVVFLSLIESKEGSNIVSS